MLVPPQQSTRSTLTLLRHQRARRYLHPHPDHLPIDSVSMDEKWAYFFVFRTLGDEDRSTPYGYWGLINYDVEYEDEKVGDIVAFRRSFAFYEGTAHNSELMEWRMMEYRLDNEIGKFTNPNNPEVICILTV
ncbi:protein CUP-SHAPED COTYLEDON 1-like [Ananas comosus]|uniref:Protein CUP-SHAPED COTYLEDON 1-like n=1 Tax=Ananas comosus TaxID=4615 RepID=A0A6P5EIZ9_ANACO|nr:protein CUP-SHAPED COTYLEDON 1-like [Ananas comosus]